MNKSDREIALRALKCAEQEVYDCLKQLYTELHVIRMRARKLREAKLLSARKKRRLLLRALIAEARWRPGVRN